ncbi:hypothetical protein IC575_025240 [Cucumis melo]
MGSLKLLRKRIPYFPHSKKTKKPKIPIPIPLKWDFQYKAPITHYPTIILLSFFSLLRLLLLLFKSIQTYSLMSYYDHQQPPVGAPPPQGFPPKDSYPPPGYPVQGYPAAQGYPPPPPPPPGYAPQYSQPPPKNESTGCLEGWFFSSTLLLLSIGCLLLTT